MSGAGIPVFWLEPTDLVRVSLRRFTYRSEKACRAPRYGHSGHDAEVVIVPDALRHVWREEAEGGRHRTRRELVSREDPRWPATCEACGEPFQPDDEWQVNARELHRPVRGGHDFGEALYTIQDAPVGAMWDAHWMRDWFTGPDGISLFVKTPGGDWHVDGEASNCTRTQWGPKEIDGVRHEKVWLGRTHYCWVRHGDPRRPETLHADKNGDTCAAGAGSILIGQYHGFLHHGHLTT